MLSDTELREELCRFSYRPGWEFDLLSDRYEGPVLWILADVVDSYNQEKTTQLRIRSLIPPMVSRDAFGEWLLWRLLQVESHECREFLRYDSQPLRDPHLIEEVRSFAIGALALGLVGQ